MPPITPAFDQLNSFESKLEASFSLAEDLHLAGNSAVETEEPRLQLKRLVYGTTKEESRKRQLPEKNEETVTESI